MLGTEIIIENNDNIDSSVSVMTEDPTLFETVDNVSASTGLETSGTLSLSTIMSYMNNVTTTCFVMNDDGKDETRQTRDEEVLRMLGASESYALFCVGDDRKGMENNRTVPRVTLQNNEEFVSPPAPVPRLDAKTSRYDLDKNSAMDQFGTRRHDNKDAAVLPSGSVKVITMKDEVNLRQSSELSRETEAKERIKTDQNYVSLNMPQLCYDDDKGNYFVFKMVLI